MTNKEVAQEILYSYMDVEKDLSQPKILIHTFKVLIHQLQYDIADWMDTKHMVIDARAILDVCDELENL